jgi:hypothetical protein
MRSNPDNFISPTKPTMNEKLGIESSFLETDLESRFNLEELEMIDFADEFLHQFMATNLQSKIIP